VKSKILGKRYATAILDLATSGDEVRAFGEQIRAFGRLLGEVPELREVLTVPLYHREFREKTLAEVCDRGGFAVPVREFFKVLLERRRIDQFEAIVEAWDELIDEREGRVRALLVSARPLPEADRDRIAATIRVKTGRQVVVRTEVDPSLIGGVRVHLGSTVIDGSVRSQIEQVKERLAR
jgi:F-type H+-transporting ATPase subunit delta